MENFVDAKPCMFSSALINSTAEEIRQTADSKGYKHLKDIITSLGGVIAYKDVRLPLLTVKSADYFLIELPMRSPQDHDNYDLARLMGHYILHSNYGEELIQVASCNDFTAVAGDERLVSIEALIFASAYLINKDVLNKKLDEGEPMYKLTEYFNVPESAIQVRLLTMV